MKYFVYLSLCISLYSCSGSLKPNDYVQYVRDPINGLVVNKVVNGLNLELQYEPDDYLALKELRGAILKEENFRKVKERFQDYIYFKTEIYSADGELFKGSDSISTQEFDSQLKFHFNEYAFLIDRKDTLKCLMSQYDNTGEVGDRYSFQMIFEKKELLSDSIIFLFHDVLNKTGLQEFKVSISTKAIKSVPDLKI